MRIPNSTGRIEQNKYYPSALPEVRSNFQSKRNGLIRTLVGGFRMPVERQLIAKLQPFANDRGQNYSSQRAVII
jgi:hypothetical protein